MEKIDIFDENEQYIRVGYRGDTLASHEYYKFVHIWIIDGNKLFIQKRGKTRGWAPNIWATNTGVVMSGEDVVSCCVRELKEEIGIDVNKDDLYLMDKLIGKNLNFNGIGYVYFIKYSGQEIVIDNDEVIDYKFVTKEELISLIDKGNFINYGKNGMEYENYFEHLFKNIEGWRD